MQVQRAGNVTQEAGNAEAHVGRVAEGSQYHRSRADKQAAKHDEPMSFQEVFLLFHLILSLFLF